MDPTTNSPERVATPGASQFNATPNLGGMAANMAPGSSPNKAPTMPEIAPSMPEVAPLGSPEQLPSPEIQTGPMQGGPAVAVPTVPLPQQPIVVQPTTITSDDSNASAAAPAAAADVDLIEKEWVDHAKKVVQSTRNDPHEQARLVAELMRDYVKKRYGKEVGKAPDDD
ncbi:hypothetical protein FWD20_02030 [Candidatus Saccharibacteria bacterium]|nr:hypothetical protein [Candidatus Saccharibacteria bacterium]